MIEIALVIGFFVTAFTFVIIRSFRAYMRRYERFCVDCKHFQDGDCLNPTRAHRDIVTGRMIKPKVPAYEARSAINFDWCGRSARRFEPRETEL